MTTNPIAGIETARTDGSSLLLSIVLLRLKPQERGPARNKGTAHRLREVELWVGKLTNLFYCQSMEYEESGVYNLIFRVSAR